MASAIIVVGQGFYGGGASLEDGKKGKQSRRGVGSAIPSSAFSGCTGFNGELKRQRLVVRAEGGAINPGIRKMEDKVVDSVFIAELSKPLTPYCRCWRSGTFPLCDGSHVKHNKATGDNVGPLLLKNK